MHVTNSFFVVELPAPKHERWWGRWWKHHGFPRRFIPHLDMAILVHWLWRPHTMLSVTHPQGDSHLYQLAILKTDGTPGTSSTDIVYSVDDPTIATVTANNAVALDLQCTVVYLAPGTAIISATGTDELGHSFTKPVITAVVTAVVPNLSSDFSAAEIS